MQLRELAGDERHRRRVAARAEADDVAGPRGAVVGADHHPSAVGGPGDLLNRPVEPYERPIGRAAVGRPGIHETRVATVPDERDDAPVGRPRRPPVLAAEGEPGEGPAVQVLDPEDRKSTRLNSSHQLISYAVFCLK